MRGRWFSIAIMIYILLAIGWWGLLLYQKNEELYDAKISNQVDQESLMDEYARDRWMIIGEGAVLGLTLLAGIWIINRSAQREVHAINNQRNFLLSVSHELKTPISAIKLALQTMRRPQVDTDQRVRLLESALEESDRLQSMVQNVLLSASLDHERMTLHIEDVSLRSFLETLLDDIEDRAETITLDMDGDVTLTVDRQSLYHAIVNILRNAVKYNDRPNVKVKVTQSNGSIAIDIADDGQGISDQYKNSVFDRFYRIPHYGRENASSTGLGLYLAKAIVEAHKGTIQILDNEPTGVTVRVRLPL